MERILARAGLTLDPVEPTFLVSADDFAATTRLATRSSAAPLPTRTAVAVAGNAPTSHEMKAAAAPVSPNLAADPMRERTPITTLEAHAGAARGASNADALRAAHRWTPSLALRRLRDQRINIHAASASTARCADKVVHEPRDPAVAEGRSADFGVLLDEMMVPASGSLASSASCSPRRGRDRVRARRGPPEPGLTTADVINATYVLPAIEVIGSRIADWRSPTRTSPTTPPAALRARHHTAELEGLDLSLAGMKLSKNGRVVSTGAGAACLDHPIHAVQWLANTFGRPAPSSAPARSSRSARPSGAAPADVLHAEISDSATSMCASTRPRDA